MEVSVVLKQIKRQFGTDVLNREIKPNRIKIVDNFSKAIDASGTECDFYKVSPTVGYKIYTYKTVAYNSKSLNEALAAYKLQLKMAKLGLGPRAYKYVIIRIGDLFRFGYSTELAQTINLSSEKHVQILRQQYRKLFKAVNAQSGAQDLHESNLGIINNKLVSIDFGNASKTRGPLPVDEAKEVCKSFEAGFYLK